MTITLKNTAISALVLIAISLSAWSILLSNSYSKITPPADPHEADAFMQDVVATVFNKQGSPSISLAAPKMSHYPASDTTKMTTPHVTVYRQSPKPWTVDSDFAEATNGLDEILFWSHVNIHHPTDIANPNTTMLTDALTVVPDQEIARTDRPVTFVQPDTTIHAIGMLANLAAGTVKLLSAAKGEYVPSP